MAGTPTAKILETIREVARIQDQIVALAEAVDKLTIRVEAIENGPRPPRRG